MSALSALSQLKELDLRQTQVSNVSALKHLKQLIIYTDADNKNTAKQWETEGLNVRIIY